MNNLTALTRMGFTPVQAARVIADAQRGCDFAKARIQIARQSVQRREEA